MFVNIIIFFIFKRERRVIKGVFNETREKKIENLTLKDITLIEGFHFNIIFKKKLLKSNI